MVSTELMATKKAYCSFVMSKTFVDELMQTGVTQGQQAQRKTEFCRKGITQKP
jgi:hypothetical protein